MKKNIIFLLCFLTLLSCGRNRANDKSTAPATQTDTLLYAKGLSIDRCDGYISVTVRNPWDTLSILERYLLVDRNNPLPAGLPQGTVVKVPVERASVYTSVHASMMEQLGCIDALIGVCEPEYITSPEILKRIQNGSIADLGLATAPNVEKMIDIDTDVIIASPYENSGFGAAEKLGIPIIQAADYMECHPLGRTEWVKFFSLLFCKSSVGDAIFNDTASHYLELRSMASESQHRPTVLLERKYGGSWFVPSGASYIGYLHSDAGAQYLYGNTTSASSIPLSFESVLDFASDAEFWLMKYASDSPFTYEDLRKEYPLYAEFDAFKRRNIYVCNTLTTKYYEDITLHPDLVLEDLVAIYHPELLPEHGFRYYLPMQY
ncbi:MAG: ABC transporter substrate-binding protein [Bacteroidia bacterium]|nr:ABC transporter substrate-binding protein [Bacteroidia bacterium]